MLNLQEAGSEESGDRCDQSKNEVFHFSVTSFRVGVGHEFRYWKGRERSAGYCWCPLKYFADSFFPPAGGSFSWCRLWTPGEPVSRVSRSCYRVGRGHGGLGGGALGRPDDGCAAGAGPRVWFCAS